MTSYVAEGFSYSRLSPRAGNRRTLARRILQLRYWGLLTVLCGCTSSPAPRDELGTTTTKPVTTPGEVPGIVNFAKVSDVLYRGAQPSTAGFGTLKQMGIRTVVDLRGKIHHDGLEGTGLRGVQIPSSAARPNERQIVEFLRLLREPANQPVFVHDEHGDARTGCYVAAYRMIEQNWTSREAEVEMRYFRLDPFWKGIPAFLDQLDVARVRRELDEPPATAPVEGAMPQMRDRSSNESPAK